MKTSKYFFLLAFCCLAYIKHSAAQKPVNELTLRYAISIESVNDKSTENKPLDGATLTVSIKGKESKTEMGSSMGVESTLFDAGNGKGYILKEYSGQKLMITLTRENWLQKNRYFNTMKFSIAPGDERIAGYTCKKATAVLENGKPFVVYFLPGIETANKDYNNAFSQLPGIPVKYELESGKLKFTYQLKEINYDNIPSGKFELPKSGYRIMTYDENQQLKKG